MRAMITDDRAPLSVDEAQEVLSTALSQAANATAAEAAAAMAPEGSGCVRSGCGAPRADEGGDFCGPCRAYLLGDIEVDPVAVAATSGAGPFSDRSLVELLQSGEIYLLTEDRRLVTGDAALAYVAGRHGVELP